MADNDFLSRSRDAGADAVRTAQDALEQVLSQINQASENLRSNSERLIESVDKELRAQIAIVRRDIEQFERRLTKLTGQKPAAKKSTSKKSTAKKSAAQKTTAKKATAKKAPAKKTTAKKKAAAKKAPAKKKAVAPKVPAPEAAVPAHVPPTLAPEPATPPRTEL